MVMLAIRSEPAGRTYAGIVTLASEVCASFSLVWRDQLPFGRSARSIAQELRGDLIREERTDEWPGTKLLGHQATVRHYRVAQSSMRVLERAGSLYAWLSPDRPEDLAFYLADGSTWLASIAHEREAWFSDSPGVDALVRQRIPELEVARTSVST